MICEKDMTENPFMILENRLNQLESILLEIRAHQTSPQQGSTLSTDQLLTVEEASKFLSLAIPTIYTLVQRRILPVCKQGKRLYFSKEELTEWVMQGRKKTRSEVDAEVAAYTNTYRRKRTLPTA
jgi:excisionase family DNA binding protein